METVIEGQTAAENVNAEGQAQGQPAPAAAVIGTDMAMGNLAAATVEAPPAPTPSAPEPSAPVSQVATDAELRNLDIIVVIDHSGSMGEGSLRFAGKTKFQELQEDVCAVAREMGQYDADGLTVVAFSNGVSMVDGVTADKVAKVFSENQPRGTTNLTDALKNVKDKAKASAKPVVAVIYTDGSPNEPRSAMEMVESIGKELGRPKIGLVFVQVGNDPGAAAFLNRLDNDMTVDVCATVSAAEAENYSVAQLVWLAQHA